MFLLHRCSELTIPIHKHCTRQFRGRNFTKRLTLAFSCGAQSAFKHHEERLLEKHALAPSAARLCSMRPTLARASQRFCVRTPNSTIVVFNVAYSQDRFSSVSRTRRICFGAKEWCEYLCDRRDDGCSFVWPKWRLMVCASVSNAWTRNKRIHVISATVVPGETIIEVSHGCTRNIFDL